MSLHNEKCLYRYREVNEKTIDALKTNRLYFSTPQYYNDLFDSLFYVNEEVFRKLVTQELKQNLNNYCDEYHELLEMKNCPKEKILSNFNNETVLSSFFHDTKIFYTFMLETIRANIKTICFSDNVLNKLMWAHYSDSFSGFCLSYKENDLLSAMVRDDSDKAVEIEICLLPVTYTKRPVDLSSYIYDYYPQWFFAYKEGSRPMFIDKPLNNNLIYKTIQTKESIWSYEKEYRLICQKNSFSTKDNISYINIRPNAIYLGTKMDEDKRQEILKWAHQEEISVYEVYVNRKSKVKDEPFRLSFSEYTGQCGTILAEY